MKHQRFVSKIALGSAQFGLNYGISNTMGKVSIEEVKNILGYAEEEGINIIDTAYAYGGSEKLLGNLNIEGWNIITKLPSLRKKNSEPQFFFHQSLRRLRKDKIYGYLIHDTSELLNKESIWDELLKFKEKGLVNKIGVSVYKPKEVYSLLDNGIIPEIVQAPFNILDQRFESVFKLLKDYGCEIHSRSTFLQGLYFLSIDGLSNFFDSVKPFLRLLYDSYPNKSERAGALLNFVIEKEFIDKVVVGIQTKKQLQENIEYGKNSQLYSDTLKWNKKNEFKKEILMPNIWPQNE